MGQMVVLIRLGIITTSILGVFSMYNATFNSPNRATVFKTVYSHCILVLVSLVYYCIAKLLFVSCRKQKVQPRPHRPAAMTDLIVNVPRLTIHNVWILVYGLGLVFFITGYCFLGIHSVCLTCAGFGVGVLGVDELVCPRVGQHFSSVYIRMRFLVLILCLFSLAMVSVEFFEVETLKYITTLDLYSLFFGIGLPFGGQFIMIAVRDNRRHNLGTVIEVCEFGFPFATFLGLFHLGVAYGQRFQLNSDYVDEYTASAQNQTGDFYNWYHNHNFTAQALWNTNGPFLVFNMFTPLFLVPGMICYVACVLEGTAVDSLLSLTFALCIEQLVQPSTGQVSPLHVCGTVLCALALIIRIASEYKPRMDRNLYNLQGESTQLTHQVVWGRRHLAKEAEELTRDLVGPISI